ncbi:MAG: tetratricopeptide repeat protein [Bacteroidota bacterium]
MNFALGQSTLDSLERKLAQEKVDSIRYVLLLELFDGYQYENPAKAKTYISLAIELSSQIGNSRYKVIALNEHADLLNGQAQNDSAIVLYEDALDLASKIEYHNGMGVSLIGLGNTYLSKGNIKKAKEYHMRNIKFAEGIGDKDGAASSYNNLGNIYNETGEYAKAMEHYTLASKKNMEVGNEKNAGIAMANIGLIHQKLNNYDEAITYYVKSDSLFKKFNFTPGRVFVLKNLGVATKNQGDLDTALEYYNTALETYKKMGLRREAGQVHDNIGNIFFEKKEYNEAVKNYHQSLRIAKGTNDSISIAMASQALGKGLLKLKKLDSAMVYSQLAVSFAEKLGIHLTAMDAHKNLGEIYYDKQEYKEAYRHLDMHKQLRDTLYTIEKRDLAEEIEAQYQNEQKTKEIALLASEKEVQELQLNKRENERNAIIVFAVLVLFLAGLLYSQYRIKQKSNKELQALDEVKSNFFANISHEFRTPLTIIKGPIEHLEQNPDEQLDPEDVTMIRRNANKVLGLVNQLLDLSRIDQGKLQLKPTEGDIYKSLRTAAASFNSHAAQRNMDYIVEIPNGILWAAFDRTKLEKVVYNLLSNAFKFTENGEKVAFEANYGDGKLEIKVSDSGKGISEEKLPFIFDRFYQVDGASTKEREGSGIGLSLSKDLVELMDGTITVSSEEGKGTFFTVQVPMDMIKTRQKSVPEEEWENKKQRTKAPTFDLQKSDVRKIPQILLVEDNEDMRHFIKSQLVKDYRILEAKNGKEGLKRALVDAPDLILSDLMMPKMDGIELCKNLKTNLETSHIPVIMLTARAGTENKIEGLETGADDYLTKPFDAKELSFKVKNLIQRQQKLRGYITKNQFAFDASKIKTTSLDKRFLEQLLELLEREHPESSFGVSQMQSAMALSKTQLHRKVKALTNESPGELLRNFRLKRAAHLLSKKTDTVTQIAYQVGFNNLSYFAKCFKELYGVSPSSY